MSTNYNLEALNVSRETIDILKEYGKILKKWNDSINLVSRNSVSNLWGRHILDSAQLGYFLNFDIKTWVDLGSGAGFPGMVIAILAKDEFLDLQMTLIESDKRKCVFLSEVSRRLELDIKVLSVRIEDCVSLNADIISARALATMDKLLFYFELHSNVGCKGLFLKGKVTKKELQKIPEISKYNINIESSLIDDSSVIVIVEKRNFETEKNY